MSFHSYGPTLVTGGAGFIGSHLVDKLVSEDVNVAALDNLATGKLSNLSVSDGKKNFHFIKEDLNNPEGIRKSLQNIETVFHMAADPEVRTGVDNPESSYKENVRNTFFLLEEIRKSNVKKLIFASSSAVYGDATVLPTPEDYGPLLPISAYGASKLACEAYVSSYCNNYGIKGIIIRPANVIGARGRHGVTWDFINNLKKDRTKLVVLGDGKQTKSYIHISDAVTGILTSLKSKNKLEIFNLGSLDRVEVMTIAKIVRKNMNLEKAEIVTTGGIDGGRGWIGDIKYAHLDISKLKNQGWTPKLSSEESVDRTSKEIIKDNM
ncbi:MAG TPA: NAD-dependent epimerase/dehydratase family protein [Nitrosopumilaceae archaeon]|nr:NAD-dependent epimerase/dehydratase family protein [Nitrosopumilaceae archaeon]